METRLGDLCLSKLQTIFKFQLPISLSKHVFNILLLNKRTHPLTANVEFKIYFTFFLVKCHHFCFVRYSCHSNLLPWSRIIMKRLKDRLMWNSNSWWTIEYVQKGAENKLHSPICWLIKLSRVSPTRLKNKVDVEPVHFLEYNSKFITNLRYMQINSEFYYLSSNNWVSNTLLDFLTNFKLEQHCTQYAWCYKGVPAFLSMAEIDVVAFLFTDKWCRVKLKHLRGSRDF